MGNVLEEEEEDDNGLAETEEMKERLQQLVWGFQRCETNPDEQPKICMVLSII